METIYVLAVVNSFDDFLFGDVLRKRELHDESVHIGILVEFFHLLEKELFSDVVFEAKQGGGEAACFTCQHLVLYVGLTASVVSDKYGGKMGTLTSSIHNPFHFFRDFSLNGCRCCFSVYQLHVILYYMC